MHQGIALVSLSYASLGLQHKEVHNKQAHTSVRYVFTKCVWVWVVFFFFFLRNLKPLNSLLLLSKERQLTARLCSISKKTERKREKYRRPGGVGRAISFRQGGKNGRGGEGSQRDSASGWQEKYRARGKILSCDKYENQIFHRIWLEQRHQSQHLPLPSVQSTHAHIYLRLLSSVSLTSQHHDKKSEKWAERTAETMCFRLHTISLQSPFIS